MMVEGESEGTIKVVCTLPHVLICQVEIVDGFFETDGEERNRRILAA